MAPHMRALQRLLVRQARLLLSLRPTAAGVTTTIYTTHVVDAGGADEYADAGGGVVVVALMCGASIHQAQMGCRAPFLEQGGCPPLP